MRGSGGRGASKPKRASTGPEKRRNGSNSTPRRSQIPTASSSSSDSQQRLQIEEEPKGQDSEHDEEVEEEEEEEEEGEAKRISNGHRRNKAAKEKHQLQAQKPRGRRKRNGNGDEEDGEDGVDEEGNVKAQKSLYTFPMRRIDRIVRSEGSDIHIKQEAIFLINKATETFIELLSKDVYLFSAKDRKNTVSYKNLASVVRKQRKYDFLSDFVPEQVKAEDALGEEKK